MYQWNPNFQVALDGKLANLNKGNAYALWKNKKADITTNSSQRVNNIFK
jgi:hypothetical protein